ncbi:PAAR domain-containing protein [Polyangium sp. 6x1]|uniref:PAAR domain-containing protein n=1 Tax=Polyangium sp. 6x1 TaxID=3042689 RepID=UPI002482BC00|nr:PAAR domain-containing protein [Polyangium sp. 6x1]MDI1448045.1 PAAR domain-containing protein [Polyangium sp. 6x1]
MPLAARVDDELTCEVHGAGIITEGCPTVIIGFQPAARVEDEILCQEVPSEIAEGCETVFIGGMPAARVDDVAVDGAVISTGFATVNIGTTPQIQVLLLAAALGLPFCEECEPSSLAGPSGEP